MTASPSLTAARSASPLTLLVVQGVLLYAGISWAAMTVARRDASRILPALRDVPLEVRPLHDDPRIVTDEQLQRVLYKLRPRLRGDRPKINDIDHALRCWGATAEFADPECLSGSEMRAILLDSRKFAEIWKDAPELLLNTRGGVRTRVAQGPASASHVDHALAVQAEIGTPLEHPLITDRQQTTLRALLEQSLRDFSLNQTEYEWSALAYSLYLPPTTRWTSSEGQEVTFDRIARRIMRQAAGQGVCYGNHRLHALTVLLRVDEQSPILNADTRLEIVAYLKDMTGQLVADQQADGSFTGNWPHRRPVTTGQQAVPPESLSGRLLATGHALEWWALAPAEVHPPRETLVRSGQWLSRTIDELTEEQVRENYTFLSHACRALAMWRGGLPAELLGNNER